MSRTFALVTLLAAVLATGAALPALTGPPAADYYLKIGDIKGESTDGAIALTGMIWDSRSEVWDSHSLVGRFDVAPPADVLARYGGAQFAGGGMSGIAVSDSGVGNPKPPARQGEVRTPREAGSGMATGRRQHAPFTIVKRVDKASPKLMEACVNGTHVGDVEVWQREGGQSTLRYTLKDAIITSYSVSGAGAADHPTETVSFTFAKIEMGGPGTPAAANNLNSSKSN